MKTFAAAIALILCSVASAAALTLMSWNVENLFDDVRDGTEYREFDPGRGAWNTPAFLQRLRSLSEVVRKAVPGGPDILLLQEVENENALRQLVDQGLRGMGYSWHAVASKKGLAATVAVVSRLPIARVKIHAVGPWKRGAPVRDIMEAQLEASGHTLYVFNNHWKSKTEGQNATEGSRRESAAVLSSRIREILSVDPNADVVAAGDYNESVDEYALTGRRSPTALMPAPGSAGEATESILLSSAVPAVDARVMSLYDPWYELPDSERGSAAWQRKWLTPDHILLSAGLFDPEGWSYRAGTFKAVRLPFLLDERGFPRRWTAKGRTSGVSDHLPILLALTGP